MPAQTIIVISTISPDSGSTVSIRIARASSSRLAWLRAICTSITCLLAVRLRRVGRRARSPIGTYSAARRRRRLSICAS